MKRPTLTRLIEIECLSCGEHRLVRGTHHFEAGACGRCGYLGWARPSELERVRPAPARGLGVAG